MIRQILNAPTGRGRGGYSPLIHGLPLDKYREIAPVEIEHVDTWRLRFTDRPGSFLTFYDVARKWEDSFVKSAYTKSYELPLVCPIVVDDAGYIYDGNHRAAAARIHVNKVPAIVVKDEKDLKGIEKLVEAGVFFWPHGFDYLTEPGEFDSIDYTLDLEELKNISFVPCFDEQAVYYSSEPFSQRALEYCVGRIIHGKQIGEDRSSLNDHFVLPGERTVQQELENGLYERIKAIALKNRVLGYSGIVDADDVSQEVVMLLMSSFKLKNCTAQESEEFDEDELEW
ncbi:hypothetical protein COV12_00020 [Candidatus Woesearchaeota archaeon CG10_big_fil_rev_8_21_14_0_10_32_24]|nr:MAG: hypothetical protein COV12_00020 [Candidatus Woesearchaeota archaeon CG10_big_fil_rev_8_21_14_0_10_32_24]